MKSAELSHKPPKPEGEKTTKTKKRSINLDIKQKNNQNKQCRRGRIGRRTKDMVDIGKERIRILLTLAEYEALKNKNEERARRYVTLARKIAMRYNIRIEKPFKYKICCKCNSFLMTGSCGKIRLHGGKIIRHCKICGRITRMPVHPIHY